MQAYFFVSQHIILVCGWLEKTADALDRVTAPDMQACPSPGTQHTSLLGLPKTDMRVKTSHCLLRLLT